MTVAPVVPLVEELFTAQRKAAVLVEALPWLRRFAGTTMVVKFGGHTMVDDELTAAFAADMVFLRSVGIKPVVVHGGGPQIGALLTKLGMTSQFRGGLRVTTPEMIDVVRMALVGEVGPRLVRAINRHGPYAIGLSGEDAGLLTAERTPAFVDSEPVDVGLVGEVTAVNTTALREILAAKHIPVVATVAVDSSNQTLNVNADIGAAAIATALNAEKFVVLTDVAGLYANWPDPSSLISRLSVAELAAMLPTLAEGMVPKMNACLQAVRGGISSAHVIDGRVAHGVLLEIFTDAGVGTMVVN